MVRIETVHNGKVYKFGPFHKRGTARKLCEAKLARLGLSWILRAVPLEEEQALTLARWRKRKLGK